MNLYPEIYALNNADSVDPKNSDDGHPVVARVASAIQSLGVLDSLSEEIFQNSRDPERAYARLMLIDAIKMYRKPIVLMAIAEGEETKCGEIVSPAFRYFHQEFRHRMCGHGVIVGILESEWGFLAAMADEGDPKKTQRDETTIALGLLERWWKVMRLMHDFVDDHEDADSHAHGMSLRVSVALSSAVIDPALFRSDRHELFDRLLSNVNDSSLNVVGKAAKVGHSIFAGSELRPFGNHRYGIYLEKENLSHHVILAWDRFVERYRRSMYQIYGYDKGAEPGEWFGLGLKKKSRFSPHHRSKIVGLCVDLGKSSLPGNADLAGMYKLELQGIVDAMSEYGFIVAPQQGDGVQALLAEYRAGWSAFRGPVAAILDQCVKLGQSLPVRPVSPYIRVALIAGEESVYLGDLMRAGRLNNTFVERTGGEVLQGARFVESKVAQLDGGKQSSNSTRMQVVINRVLRSEVLGLKQRGFVKDLGLTFKKTRISKRLDRSIGSFRKVICTNGNVDLYLAEY